MKDLLSKHLETICEEIGARPTGSLENQRAVSYTAMCLREYGFEVVLDSFDCMDWVNEGAVLKLGDEAVEVLASDYSAPCNLVADYVSIGSVEALKEANLEGKIAVIYGELCKEPLMPKNFVFWNPEEHQKIIGLLEEKNPLAIVTVSFGENTAIPVIEDGDFDIPVALVKGDDLDKFIEASDKNMTLKIKTERKESSGANVIARKGSGKEKIVLSAHIDTKPDTCGALDNGSGVAVLLTLASLLDAIDNRFTVEIVFFNGEDYYSNPGEVDYMTKYLSKTDNFALAINIDGVGLKRSQTSYSFYECNEVLRARVIELAHNLDGYCEIDPWPQGDHMMFAMAGIPTIAITSKGIFDILETVIHIPADNMNQIDLSILEDSVNFLNSLLK